MTTTEDELLATDIEAPTAAEVGDEYVTDEVVTDAYRLNLGDSCERLAELADESVDLSVYSPPFASLFTYSPSPRDIGNCSNWEEFIDHYSYVIRELLRVTRPGRKSCVHVADVATTKATHGVQGMRDLSGAVIAAHVDAGWVWESRTFVDKNPQALRHGQRVMTPSGWCPIEQLRVGDAVTGSDGEATKVIGVWPQGHGEVLRVTFSDGATVECDAAHLWSVRNAADLRNGRWRTVRTDKLLADGLNSPGGRPRYEVPLTGPVQYEREQALPLHPYVVGALLGDGNVTRRSTVSLHTQRKVAARIRSRLTAGHTITEQPNTSKGDDTAEFRIGHPDWHRNDVLTALRELGVQGQHAWEKRVPARYMTASVDDRRELLTGLLDTDGTVKLSGSVWFGTTSEQLARDVVDLVRSLGGIGKLRCETTRRYVHNGEERQGRPAWLVCLEIDGDPLVTLPAKVERWRRARRRWTRRIVSIEPVAQDERTCITVAAPDGLFVTEGFIVTHNSVAVRTKAHHLMFKTKNKDSAQIYPCAPDQLLVFRKPGENTVPIPHNPAGTEHGEHPGVSHEDWILWARPVWLGVRETHTLSASEARDDADERHLHCLSLDFIERCVRLYSNPDDLVVTPCGGVGSEAWMAHKLGRRAWSCELKPSYWRQAVRNLRELDAELAHPKLIDLDEVAS